MATKIVLPKVYEDGTGKYPQHKGKNKISYSQYTSWKDPEYQPDYIVQYFSGIKQPSGIWADFGSEVGNRIQAIGEGTEPLPTVFLTDACKAFIDGLEYPENSVYEDEIVVDLNDLVVQAFTDRTENIDENTVGLVDFKTGNMSKKTEFYSGEDYGQTTLYCYGKVQEGKTIAYSRVRLFDRKGNNSQAHPLRLSGEKKDIETPYSEDRAATVLKDIRKVAEEISDCYKSYLKYFGKN